jgi:dTDP-4-amino-4,6-dideoxygalactose transaminase
MKIPFFKPYITGNEFKYIQEILDKNTDIAGDGIFTKKVSRFLEKRYKVNKVFLTTSGTTALEMAVRLLNLTRNDEIIVPSFTFSSTANAILLAQGIKLVFAEVKSNTLNIDPEDIKRKITAKTKAIIVVHYAGVSCDMDEILKIAKNHNLKIIEDAAQCIESKYKDKFLGTIGDFGCLSFHETKNITCGEGGALFINTKKKQIAEKAEIIREKGTNRSKFFRGEIDKYTWVDIGSSYLPSDLLAAFLYAQLEQVKKITELRLKIYKYFKDELINYEKKGIVKIPCIPAYANHNAHIFYLIFKNGHARDRVLKMLKENGIGASFHYIPLHSAPQGLKLGYKKEDFPITERISTCLLRLPLFAGMTKIEMEYIIINLKNILNQL